jgi:hypothetical protein
VLLQCYTCKRHVTRDIAFNIDRTLETVKLFPKHIGGKSSNTESGIHSVRRSIQVSTTTGRVSSQSWTAAFFKTSIARAHQGGSILLLVATNAGDDHTT